MKTQAERPRFDELAEAEDIAGRNDRDIQNDRVQCGPHRREGAPVDRGRPQARKRLEVNGCGVSLVGGESVTWVAHFHFMHFAIPRYLGQNGGSSDCGYRGITLNYRC